jgi:hypothetical protein
MPKLPQGRKSRKELLNKHPVSQDIVIIFCAESNWREYSALQKKLTGYIPSRQPSLVVSSHDQTKDVVAGQSWICYRCNLVFENLQVASLHHAIKNHQPAVISKNLRYRITIDLEVPSGDHIDYSHPQVS